MLCLFIYTASVPVPEAYAGLDDVHALHALPDVNHLLLRMIQKRMEAREEAK